MLRKIVSANPQTYLDQKYHIGAGAGYFNARNDIFNRSIWDDKVDAKDFYRSYDIANYKPKKSKGFDHWDFAFRNASWHLTDRIGERHFEETGEVEGFTDYYTLQSPGPTAKIEINDLQETTRRIKLAASMFGSGNTGICELDRRWVYSHKYNRKTGENPAVDLSVTLKYAIILIIPMDHGLSKTYPTALSGASTGLGYTTGLGCAISLAQFITNLGFEAVASMNDTALNIPMAIQAGLGEYGRNGLLITPQFGPNVRIAKVFTDLPLVPDHPVEFGVRQFCASCNLCATSCPVRAIPDGEPQSQPPNISSLEGMTKYTVDAEKCFRFWVGLNSDCAICIRVCPYNKDFSKWWHRLALRWSSRPLVRQVLLFLEKKLKFGEKQASASWWKHGKT
ncbi:MAG: reductive dehalogenase [Saprospiraceae bacterium]|nr:reductive dehalogenase [Saprospiraceae bacterium]MCB9319272.1 reductive dehalogenase [Lewinellaceae bacterium]